MQCRPGLPSGGTAGAARGRRIQAALTAYRPLLVSGIEVHERLDPLIPIIDSARTACLAVGCVWPNISRRSGRRGRAWVRHSPPIFTCPVMRFTLEAALLSGLSLAVGVALLRTLTGMGIPELGLKWPNDVCGRRHKAGRCPAGVRRRIVRPLPYRRRHRLERGHAPQHRVRYRSTLDRPA